MSLVKTGNATHDAAVAVSEGTHQAALAAATTQAAARAASITHYRTCRDSAIANKCGTDTFVTALRELGSN